MAFVTTYICDLQHFAQSYILITLIYLLYLYLISLFIKHIRHVYFHFVSNNASNFVLLMIVVYHLHIESVFIAA